VLLLVPLPSAAGDWGLADLMTRLGEVPRYRATFRETKHLAVLSEPLVQEGTLLYEAPGHLRKVVTSPHEKIYDIRGDTLTISSPEEGVRRVDIGDHPLLRSFVTTLRGILSGDRAALADSYRLRLEGGAAEWTLRLTPTDPALRERIREVEVHGSGARIEVVKTVEADGDYSRLAIRQGDGD